MGIKDSQALHKIYEKIKEYCKENNLPYSFTVDDGDWETAIEIVIPEDPKEDTITFHPPWSKNWDTNPNIFCPDLMDFHHKKIVEYEEEGQKKLSGARLARKGHGPAGDIPNKRDTRRGEYYDSAKFDVLRFYEKDLKDENWDKLYDFLQK